MLGCDEMDPDCLHTVDDLIDLIMKIGFIPLFSNSVRGFSVEERTVSSCWWTGDSTTDPWEWRQILASHPDIAYGKFFDRRAGFISKEWFPVFANYRRDGYDFDALYEDELASYREKKIMDVFECDEEAVGRELMSNEVKNLAGFGKRTGDGQAPEKNFEGTVAELQMRTYLIMSEFRQRTNKKGEEYGWHLAMLETPETKWGYDLVTREYRSDPRTSWTKIVGQIKTLYPEAEEGCIRQVLGFRHSGGPVIRNRKERPPKDWIIPSNPKYYDIVHAFDDTNEIDWKQGAGIQKGDTVYLYVGAPVSAVLYKCLVIETDIPYEYQNKNLTITALMKIRLEQKYQPDRFTFERLKKEFGIYAVRGPRGITDSLRSALSDAQGLFPGS